MALFFGQRVAPRGRVCPRWRTPRYPTIAAILSERKDRTELGLSKYAAEAAEQAAEHRDKLGIAGKVKDVASVIQRCGLKNQKPIKSSWVENPDRSRECDQTAERSMADHIHGRISGKRVIETEKWVRRSESLKPSTCYDVFSIFVTLGNRCMALRRSSVERCVHWRETYADNAISKAI